MTEATAAAVQEVTLSSSTSEDSIFDFTTTEWVAPALLVPHKDESSAETKRRYQADHVYRSKTDPTKWSRYLTLGRYAMSGPDFETLMHDQAIDALKVHCVIWYNFAYHVDRQLECSPKLEAWAEKRSKPYLTEQQPNALLVDTVATTWKKFAKQQALSDNWSQVKQKPGKKSSAKQSKLPFVSAAKLGSNSKPSTIAEENSNQSTIAEVTSEVSSTAATSNNHQSNVSDTVSASSDGKMSALLPSSNVPVCDGTYRVTVRWKFSMDVNRISRQASEMKDAIYNMLNELFSDDDGYLYNWSDDGTDNFKAISKMTPTEVRNFICPSLTIIPSQSLAIIPLRYGFSGKTPGNWRNSAATQATLTKYTATASISNSTSTSGDLVISGYLLLKAPMTTHRLRYLQSLRSQLPDATPPFDILLHKRSPTDELIPHLVIQCGEKHVHPLCEALMSVLTGNNSPIFIPRSALLQMPTEEVSGLFQTHDTYVKSLQWLPLSPLLSNLDKPRIEHYPDGSTVERTTREWARNIKLLDGKEFAKCDVVNGGTDQLSYLLFPPTSGEAANDALEKYRKLINPFRHREERYSQKVGPVTGPQFSRKVIANIEFMKKLSSDMSVKSTHSCPRSSDNSTAPPASTSTTSSVSASTKSNRPPPPASTTPSASEHHQSDSDTVDTAMTDNTCSTSQSKPSSDRMSTTTARFREIDKILKNQKQLTAKHEQLSSDRISQIERQLHRITDMEGKLDSVKQEFSTRLDDFEGKVLSSMKRQIDSSGEALESMNVKLEKLMLVVSKVMNENVQQAENATGRFHDPGTNEPARQAISVAQAPPISDIPTDQHSSATTVVNSPQKKRIRSTTKRGRKRDLNEATRAALESLKDKPHEHSEYTDSSGNAIPPTDKSLDTQLTPVSGSIKRHLDNTSFSKYLAHETSPIQMDDAATSTPPNSPPVLRHNCDEDLLTPRSSTPPSPMEQATDPESQYTDKSSSEDEHSQSDNDSSSLRRGAKH